MKQLHIETPLVESMDIARKPGQRIWFKMEAVQPGGSFKARGIGHACREYVMRGASALVASSGGNAGLAVACSGRILGVPVMVIVPETTKRRAIDLIEQQGARVIVEGRNWNESHMAAQELSRGTSAYIHPFDDHLIWTGHSTMVDEILAAGVMPDAVVLSVGGGGLMCGVAEGLQRNNLGHVPIVAVETEGTASLRAAWDAGEHVGIDRVTGIATSLAAKKVAARAFELKKRHPVVSHIVSDIQALRACYRFLGDHRILVEPACGASISAVYNRCDALKEKHAVVAVVCGGAGVTLDQLQAWQQELPTVLS